VGGRLLESVLGEGDLAQHGHGVGVVLLAKQDLLAEAAGLVHLASSKCPPCSLQHDVGLKRTHRLIASAGDSGR
jgi:hypothetical protein